ncbi:WD40 repeat domain-containing protein, partial [Psychrobacter sp. SIMBA_152]
PHDRAQDLSLAFSPDGSCLASGNANGKIVQYDLRDVKHKRLRELSIGHASVSSLAFSRNGKRFAAADWEGVVYAWDTDGYGVPVVMEEHHD